MLISLHNLPGNIFLSYIYWACKNKHRWAYVFITQPYRLITRLDIETESARGWTTAPTEIQYEYQFADDDIKAKASAPKIITISNNVQYKHVLQGTKSFIYYLRIIVLDFVFVIFVRNWFIPSHDGTHPQSYVRFTGGNELAVGCFYRDIFFCDNVSFDHIIN